MLQEDKLVSVVIPVFNESNVIVDCLNSLLDCDYPKDKLEFLIADGQSTDNTVEIINNFADMIDDVTIKVFENPNKTQGYGLNIAIGNVDKNTEVILRADAHSIYPKNYIHDCVKTLLSTNADNVGGAMVPIGKTPLQKAISFCMSHPLGVGNAKFHLGNFSGFVDTVYLGCFKRNVFEKVGLFDPMMTPNEDAEFNLRICKSGGKIYLDSEIRIEYFTRDTFSKLTKQYFHYGRGRNRTFKKHRKLTSFRQLAPPLWFVLSLVLLVLGFFWKPFFLPIILYAVTLFICAGYGAVKLRNKTILLSAFCFAIMHYAWGLGFLYQMPLKTR